MPRQQLPTATHFKDSLGNPAGGSSYGVGFAIAWQNGPLGRDGERLAPNGAFVEDVLRACENRIQFYQAGKFACDENAKALACLQEALEHLEERTARRERQGVEGTHAGN